MRWNARGIIATAAQSPRRRADIDKCVWMLVMNARDFINLLVAGAENLDWTEIRGFARPAALLDYYQVLRI